MVFRFLSFLPPLGLFLAFVGCSGLDARPEPIAASVAPQTFMATQNRASVHPHHDLGAKRASVIRLQAFDQPAESSPGRSPELLPASMSNPAANATLEPRTIEETLRPPVTSEVVAFESTVIDLDLTGALAIAAGQNPRIAFAAARYREAYARLESAQTLWLPSIRAGMSFNHHDGALQASGGQVLDASRSSLQAGLGARAVGAGTPAVPGVAAEFHTSDAVFQPKIAAHSASARDAAAEATTNDTMLATALAYLELLRTTQQLRIAEETRDNAETLAELTATFARTGQGPQSDADRAQTEHVRRRNDVSRAQEHTRVATARLTELLSLDPLLEVRPQEPTIVPIDLVSPDLPAAELVATGLANRPELAEAQYLVCEAVNRYRREKYAPLLPSVLLGISQSGFGGGFGSDIGKDRGRFDFDATVYWELRNLGLGERAKRDETGSRYDQVRALQVGMLDRVAREVVEAHAQVRARQGQIDVAASGVKSATNSYGRNLARIREGQGLPIEAIQSMQALDEARREYLRTLADYNEAQFRLQRALGWPIQ